MATGTTVPTRTLSIDKLHDAVWAIELYVGSESSQWPEGGLKATLDLAHHLEQLGNSFATISGGSTGIFSQVMPATIEKIKSAWGAATPSPDHAALCAIHRQLCYAAASIRLVCGGKSPRAEADVLLRRLWDLYQVCSGQVPACV